MTKEEFIKLLPALIPDPVNGDCKLHILADTNLIKTVCYMNSKKVRFGYRSSNSWAELYILMVDYLEDEVFK